jgi:cytochrome c oxidase subunit I+III
MSAKEAQSPWPFLIGLGLGILFLGFALGAAAYLLGAVVLSLGLGGWIRDDFHGRFVAPEVSPGEQWPFEGVGKIKLGMWIFLAGEVILFGALLASYVMVRLNSPSWPTPGEILDISHGTLNTFILLTSSLTLVLGLAAIRNGNQLRLRVGLILTFILGVAFLLSKASEWRGLISHGFTLRSGLPGSTYYVTTGVHGLHVLAGLVGLLYLIVKTQTGAFTVEDHDTIENFALYWHFVDIVWVFIFPMFYLIP